MGVLTPDEMVDTLGDCHEEALETLELIADGVYNIDRPSNLILAELVQVIKLMEERLNILGE